MLHNDSHVMRYKKICPGMERKREKITSSCSMKPPAKIYLPEKCSMLWHNNKHMRSLKGGNAPYHGQPLFFPSFSCVGYIIYGLLDILSKWFFMFFLLDINQRLSTYNAHMKNVWKNEWTKNYCVCKAV